MKILRSNIAVFFFWVCFFVVTRGLFLVYHYSLTATLTIAEIFKVFVYGLRMDLSFAAYICILPFLLFFIQTLVQRIPAAVIVRWYNYVLIVLLSFLVVADLELYSAWGFRLDTTPLQYFKSPKEMGSTISSAPLVLLAILFLALTALTLFIYRRFFDKKIGIQTPGFRIYRPALSLLLLVVLVIPLRGGIQKIPINVSDVYFSHKLYADHAAINLPWNIMASVLQLDKSKNPFNYMSNEEAARRVEKMYADTSLTPEGYMRTDRPDIVLIILESFTAKWIESLGGEKGVTPNLEKIAADGLLFTQFYASGDRSEKGQVAILSGYPNQAITSIVKYPTKTQTLPGINEVLKPAGYTSGYTYGGELGFANIKSYLINIGIDRLTGKYDFPMAERTTSWGVHDQYVFDHVFDEISNRESPYFETVFSLSSHEPYDVPMKPHFPNNDEVSRYRNSVYYTDSILGNFVERLRHTPRWNNTLLILVADHGHHLPGYDPVDAPSKFHIPLIFSGGALLKRGRINTPGSQTDIAATLLGLLRLQDDRFSWSKNLLDTTSASFAFYSFNNGFGFITSKGRYTVDNVSQKIIRQEGDVSPKDVLNGKAYMQYSYQDFLDR